MTPQAEPFGIFNINKPVGPTSHDIVAKVRRGIRHKRVGHSGTLDPLASGVLVVAIGRATRLVEYLTGLDKAYDAVVQLGITTDTYDLEGNVLAGSEVPALSADMVETALNPFRGTISQVPPVYSAIKVGGRSAHARARAGENVTLTAREITIYNLTLTRIDLPYLYLKVHCSSGTYIRSLAHDIGQALGTGGALASLSRTAVGGFSLDDAVAMDQLSASFEDGSWRDHVLAAESAVAHLPMISVNNTQAGDLCHGRRIESITGLHGVLRAHRESGELVAIVQASDDGIKPSKVFANPAS